MDSAGRPADLIWLVDYWSRNSRFGSYEQMLETSVTERLKEPNPQRGRADELAPDRAMAALERVGAALTFGHRSEISVPDSDFAFRSSESQAFDLQAILPDFTQGECRQLLRLPVFDAATYGRVRLHNDNQGVMRSYLAARWIKRRLEGNCPRSAIYELLFTETYGKMLVRPSVHQTVAWLSIWDADVAREVLDRDPQLLLSAGDPSSLSVKTREEVLSRVVEATVTSGYRFSQYPREALKRIALPDMARVIERLWDQHKPNAEVRHLLLLLIEHGRLKDCVHIAKESVWGGFTDPYTQVFAGRALLATANAQLLGQYAELVRSNVENMRGITVMDALEKLFPSRLSVDELLSIFGALSPAQRDESYGMQIHGPRLVERVTRRGDLEQLLSGLLDLMGERPAAQIYAETAAEKAYEPAIEQACHQLLTMISQEEAPKIVLDVALRLAADQRYRQGRNFNRVLKELHSSAARRRLALWRAAEKLSGHPLAQKSPVSNLLQVEVLGWPAGLVYEDLDWLIEDIKTRATDSMRSLAVDAAMRLWRDNGQSASGLDRIKAAANANPAALDLVETWLTPPVTSPEMQRLLEENEKLTQEHARRQAERDQSWRDFIDHLKANPKQLLTLPPPTSESVDGRLFGLWQLVSSETASTNRYAVDDISFLEPTLGRELTQTFQAALIAFWRQRKPTLESEREANKRNMVNSVDCMGLVGASLEAKNKHQWATRLNSEEAIRAAQYATIEINGFPVWFESLAHVWPQQVGDVLMQEVRSQLTDPAPEPYHGILDDLVQTSPEIGALVTRHLPEELRARPELTARYLSLILDIVTRHLTDDSSKSDFTQFALDRFESATNEEVQALYLGAAFSSGPVEAAEALTAKLDRIDASSQASLGKILLPRIFGNHGMSRGAKAPELPFEVLERLVYVAYRIVRPDEDNNRPSGVAYSSDGRDFAESARGAAFNQLCNTPGYKTFLAVEKMASTPGFPIDSEHLRRLALSRALHDSERAAWPPREACELEQQFDLSPRTPSDLRSLVMSRFNEIQHDLLHADFSQGATVKSLPNEREVQKWVASELKSRKGRAYSLEREPHVVDEKEPDIRLHSTATDARLPVEIKVAESWTLKQLDEALSNQLCGKYMRERGDTHGILLVVHQEPRSEGWEDDTGRMLNFAQVVTHLQKMADGIAGTSHEAPWAAIAVIDVSSVPLKRRKAGSKKMSAKKTTGRKSLGRKAKSKRAGVKNRLRAKRT